MPDLASHLRHALRTGLLIGSLAGPAGVAHAAEDSQAAPLVEAGAALNCPSPSNCVNSLAGAERLPALRFNGSAADGMARLLRTLAAFPQATIVSRQPLQVEVVFTTFLGFRDQVLFRLDVARQRIDFRSRSTIGRYDFGKNRARMLEFSARFGQEPERTPHQ